MLRYGERQTDRKTETEGDNGSRPLARGISEEVKTTRSRQRWVVMSGLGCCWGPYLGFVILLQPWSIKSTALDTTDLSERTGLYRVDPAPSLAELRKTGPAPHRLKH